MDNNGILFPLPASGLSILEDIALWCDQHVFMSYALTLHYLNPQPFSCKAGEKEDFEGSHASWVSQGINEDQLNDRWEKYRTCFNLVNDQRVKMFEATYITSWASKSSFSACSPPHPHPLSNHPTIFFSGSTSNLKSFPALLRAYQGLGDAEAV